MKLGELGASAAVVALAMALLVQGEAGAQAACTWTKTDLPLPAGDEVYGISDATADGVWAVSGSWGRKAFVWQGDQVKVLTFREDTILFGVSGTGAVAGNTGTQSFRLSADGVREVLQPVAGADRTWVTAMNSAGDVAGTSGGSAVLWPTGSVTPRELPDAHNRKGWSVRDVDEEGRVIAERGVPAGPGGPNGAGALWDRDGNQVMLEPLPGHASVHPVTVRGGRVVGRSGENSNVQGTVTEWGTDGKVVRSLPGLWGYPLGINTRGDVVAYDGTQIAVVRPSGETERVAHWGNHTRMSEDGSVVGMFADSDTDRSGPRRMTCV
jgi:hypothetical protein